MPAILEITIKIVTGLLLIAVWEIVPDGHVFVLGFIGAAIADTWIKNNTV